MDVSNRPWIPGGGGLLTKFYDRQWQSEGLFVLHHSHMTSKSSQLMLGGNRMRISSGKYFNKFMVLALSTSMIMASSCTPAPPAQTPAPTITQTPAATNTQIPASTAVPTVAPTPSVTANTVQTATKADLGTYLVDAKGMTLYYFTKDSIGNSTAVGAVLQAWPLFNDGTFVLPSTLSSSDFGIVTRPDGQKVTTYKGWPLYYFAKDLAPGDTLGEGVGGAWFVLKVPFYTVMIQTKTDLGNYLIDSKGMTLYYFTKDSVGKSVANATVLQSRPIFSPTNFIVPSSLKVSDFSSISRDDGKMQATYKGWPLYNFVNDQASGDTKGQGVNGVWFVINPDKFPPTPSPSAPPQPAGGGGGGGGY